MYELVTYALMIKPKRKDEKMKKININKEQEYILLNYLKEELKYFENEEDSKNIKNVSDLINQLTEIK